MENSKSIHDKAIRLLEGGIVEIDSDWFYLKKLPDYYNDIACNECSLDSICKTDHATICGECDAISNRKCFLQLAHKNK